MIRRENPNFVASIYVPNPKEVSYWIDLTEGPDGQIIKTFVNNKWVKVNQDKNDEQDADITQLQQKVTTLENTMPTKVGQVEVTGSGNAVTSASIADGKLTLTKGSTYNNYTLPNATTATIGGVKQATAVADLEGTEDAAAICTKVNALLAALRTAGILAA